MFVFFIFVFLTFAHIFQNNKNIDQLQTLPNTSDKIAPSSNKVTNDFYLDIKSVFLLIKNKYKSNLLKGDYFSMWWINTDGLNIINDNSKGIELNIDNCDTPTNLNLCFKELTQLISKEINKIMKQNGFKLNQINSSKSVNDGQFYDYIQAYEKGSVKAVLTANPDDYTISFVFTDNFDKNYKEQYPYLKDLEIKNAVIRIQKKSKNFIKLYVQYRRTGAFIIAKEVNGKWIKVYSGQVDPSCKVVKQYSIPKEITPGCY
ncbi:MAG: hypothetical protein KatS3mg089_0721 [Patescibacteria group bacterium]|nr:MAG: hypothetical protein KatS3mg089_0721 [Patescibacteria group bacterium]